MENAAYIAVAIFAIAYILIISEKIQRTVVGIVGDDFGRHSITGTGN